MGHPASAGKWLRSPGSGFAYEVLGPCCRLFDREELPWPCCRLAWRSKEPSWNRVGRRFVADLAASRCPSYWVRGVDQWGVSWYQVLTLYSLRLDRETRRWWVSRTVPSGIWPALPESVVE